MNRKWWLAVIIVIILAGVTYPIWIPCCVPRRHTVEGFLSDTGEVVRFDRKLVASLCQLEVKTDSLVAAKRLCPTGNPDSVPIPTYPPKQ